MRETENLIEEYIACTICELREEVQPSQAQHEECEMSVTEYKDGVEYMRNTMNIDEECGEYNDGMEYNDDMSDRLQKLVLEKEEECVEYNDDTE